MQTMPPSNLARPDDDPAENQPPSAEPVDLSIVVPTYRGALSLEELTDELRAVCEQRGLSYEILLVNDCSPDDTWDVVQRLAAANERIIGIDLLHNHGQPAATMCGLAASRGSLVATMDDDLEHRPDQLAVLLDALQNDRRLDAVVATWPVERSFGRDIGSRIHSLADRVAWGTPKGFRHTAFRLMTRPVCDALVEHRTRTPVVGPMLHRVSSRVTNVPIEHGARLHGSSGFTIGEGARRVVRNFASGSTAPLKLISGLGLVLAFAAFTVGAALLLRWAFGAESPSGWLSVMLTTIFVGGANLLAFGILGSYIDIIVREVRQPPRWSVRSVIGESAADREGWIHGE
jgi:glycosyltransferase involved in cell wall biosynthesis